MGTPCSSTSKCAAFRVKRVASVAADDQIGADLRLSCGRFGHHAANASAFVDQVDSLVLQAQVEAGKLLRLGGQKIKQVPLRHQRDELAVRRQRSEIGGAKGEVSEYSAGGGQFLMRNAKEVFQNAELVHHLEG